MAPKSEHNTLIAYPSFGTDGFVSGWYRFADDYLKPEVLYGSWPPITSIKLGGRSIECDRPVAVKIKLLEPHEDQAFWCGKKQHTDRVNLGEFHRDFGDVEVAYSFSSPKTHVFFSGYSVHFEEFEHLSMTSYNATVMARPEHVLDRHNIVFGSDSRINPAINPPPPFAAIHDDGCCKGEMPSTGGTEEDRRGPEYTTSATPRDELVACNLSQRKLQSTVAQSKVYFPLYNCQVPNVREDVWGNETVNYFYTPQHLNDCERNINLRDAFNIGVKISSKSSPVSVPPMYPPLRPYEFPQMVHRSSTQHTKGGRHPGKILKLKNRPNQLDAAGQLTSGGSMSTASTSSSETQQFCADTCLLGDACDEISAYCCLSQDASAQSNLRAASPGTVMVTRLSASEMDKHVNRKRPKESLKSRKAPRQNFPRQNLPHQNFPHQNLPHQNFPRQNLPQQNFPRPNSPQQNFPRPNSPQQNFPRPNSPQQNFPRPNSPQQNFPRQNQPRQNQGHRRRQPSLCSTSPPACSYQYERPFPVTTNYRQWDGYVVNYRRPNDIAPWVNDTQLDACKNLQFLGSPTNQQRQQPTEMGGDLPPSHHADLLPADHGPFPEPVLHSTIPIDPYPAYATAPQSPLGGRARYV